MDLNCDKIESIRETVSKEFCEVDHDKMLMQGFRFKNNEKVKRHTESNSDESIKEALIKCAKLDYYSRYENY